MARNSSPIPMNPPISLRVARSRVGADQRAALVALVGRMSRTTTTPTKTTTPIPMIALAARMVGLIPDAHARAATTAGAARVVTPA